MAVGGSQICWRFGSPEAQSWVFVRSEQVPWQELVPFGIWLAGRPSAPAPSSQSVERAPPLRLFSPLPWASRLCLALETPFC